MKKVRKMELSELFNGEITLERSHCFNSELERLYYDYLNNKNIELRYHNKNLLKYIEEQKKSLLDYKSHDENLKDFKRKEKLIFIRKCLFRGLFPLALYGCHVAGKDYMIHEEANAYNSYAMINYLGNDTNNDGIDEINTWILNYVNDYFKPTENKYYANSNLFYDLCDETRVSDNISFMIAMDILDYDIIEIDGVKYSKTGNVSEIHYTECLESQKSGVISSSIIFENEEQIQEYLKEKLDKKNLGKSFIIDSVSTYEVELLDEIPTIIKSKIDGSIELKEPNKVMTMIAKRFIK